MGSFIFLSGILILSLMMIIVFLINFYRNPERKIPPGNNIVSPADGVIISIIKTGAKNVSVRKGLIGKISAFTGDVSGQCHVISIFMSPLDVHVNRSPIEGIVKSVKHSPGKFFYAKNLEKSLENEKNEIVIENKRLKVKAIQIAGFLARRIQCYVRPGQKVNKGSRIGMIALGSQVTFIMPAKGINVRVAEGQKVKAGSSIIADMG